MEAGMTQALTAYFDQLRQRVIDELAPQIPASRKVIRIPASFWSDEAKRLLSILLPFIQGGAEGGVNVARGLVEALGLTIDWTLPFTQAANWARVNAAELVTQVLDTTKERIRTVVANWIEAPDMTLPDLWRQLQADHGFSRYRAELIAQTETTKAYTEGEIVAAREIEAGGLLEYVKQWQTVMDERVCHVCEPMQGKTAAGSSGEFDTLAGLLQGPPAHPGCRCWVNIIPQVPK
jgi:SPP1 gp7 family putative phage head morphogenesis protein